MKLTRERKGCSQLDSVIHKFSIRLDFIHMAALNLSNGWHFVECERHLGRISETTTRDNAIETEIHISSLASNNWKSWNHMNATQNEKDLGFSMILFFLWNFYFIICWKKRKCCFLFLRYFVFHHIQVYNSICSDTILLVFLCLFVNFTIISVYLLLIIIFFCKDFFPCFPWFL